MKSHWMKTRDALGEFFYCPQWHQSYPVEKDWRDNIRIGDVLREGRNFRVVRDCLYKREGILVSVTFTIRRASWTHRCYTVIGRHDLIQRKFRPLKAKAKMATELDATVNRCIFHSCDSLTPADVRGMA